MTMRWLTGCAGALAVALLVGACTSGTAEHGETTRANTQPRTQSTVVRPATATATPLAKPAAQSGSAAQNKSAARAEAARLAARAVLPPGAIRTARSSRELTGPAVGTPIVTQVVDHSASYRIAWSLARTRAWFTVHGQPGLSGNGTSTTRTGADVTTYGWEYDTPSAHQWAWGTANLQIGIASAGTATAVRVDGVAQWLDPTPTRDTGRGRTLRLTATQSCPASDQGLDDVRNPGAGDLDTQLLPAAAPTGGLICTYAGTNSRAFRLLDSRRLSSGQAAVVAKRIRALPLGSYGTGPHSCPMDDSRATVLVLSYPHRADVDIWEHVSGCGYTDNGHIVSNGLAGR